LGIGVGFVFYHTNLGVARFRSPANTHAIYQVQRQDALEILCLATFRFCLPVGTRRENATGSQPKWLGYFQIVVFLSKLARSKTTGITNS
jgi:hypothetical protein